MLRYHLPVTGYPLKRPVFARCQKCTSVAYQYQLVFVKNQGTSICLMCQYWLILPCLEFNQYSKLAATVKVKNITVKIMETVALDEQLFSICQDKQFHQLIHHLEPRYNLPSATSFADVSLSSLYGVAATYFHRILRSNITDIRFTTDSRSSEARQLSLPLNYRCMKCQTKLSLLDNVTMTVVRRRHSCFKLRVC